MARPVRMGTDPWQGRGEIRTLPPLSKGVRMSLSAGALAPDFTLADQDGQPFTLSAARGSWLVLYSYPKDNTPGCTQEAKDFSCLAREFAQAGAQVLGISPDKAPSHRRFITQQELVLRLLCDEDHAMLEAWGAWGLKKFMGREYMGVVRSTWIVDPQGRVAALWSQVKVKEHAAEVLSRLTLLQQG